MKIEWKGNRALIAIGAMIVVLGSAVGLTMRSTAPPEKCRPLPSTPLLASLYERGDGLPQDYAKAAELYRQEAEKGDYTSQYKLGMFYLSGSGVNQDYREAYYWLSLAASKNEYADQASTAAKKLKPEEVAAIDRRVHDWQQEFYGRKCTTETIGMPAIDVRTLPQDIKKNRPAAEHGLADAQRVLAYYYYHAQDFKDSYFWSLLAARDLKCGSEWGCKNSGSIEVRDASKKHLTLEELNKIEKRAHEWKPTIVRPADVGVVKAKADEGDSLAQWQIGKMYEAGDGVKQDLAEAYFWYSLSMKMTHGDVSSGTENYVASLTHHLSPEIITATNARAREWLAKHGSPH